MAGRTIPEFDCRGVAHRLRLARMVLDLSVAEAAAAAGRSLRTWQKYEVAGTNRAAPLVRFAAKYDVSLDWLVCGKADRTGPHLHKRATGNLAILPRRCASLQTMDGGER